RGRPHTRSKRDCSSDACSSDLSGATVVVSLIFWPVAGTTVFYGAVALAQGVLLLVQAHRMLNRYRAGLTGAKLKTMGFFHLTNAYLALLVGAVTIDPLVALLIA